MSQPPGAVPVGSMAGSPGGPGRPSVQDTGTTTGWDDLAVTLSGLARSLHQQDDPYATLEDVVAAAVELIPGVEQASISAVVARRRVVPEAASGDRGLPYG